MGRRRVGAEVRKDRRERGPVFFQYRLKNLNGKQSVLPMHNTELKTGTLEGIKKQLGLK